MRSVALSDLLIELYFETLTVLNTPINYVKKKVKSISIGF